MDTDSQIPYLARLVKAVGRRRTLNTDVVVPSHLPTKATRNPARLRNEGVARDLQKDSRPPYGKWGLYALGTALVLFGSFAFGFIACLHLKSAPSSDSRRLYLRHQGDAPPSVQSGVLTTLRAFQDGYVKRDPKQLDAFMNRMFSRNEDILITGTDSGEWVRGYPAASRFIRTDWEAWGEFRFAVDESIICSSGDVAWVNSVGAVHFKGGDRPLRFSAILARNGDSWLFRELHFQWDETDPRSTDIFRTETYLRLMKMGSRRLSPQAILPDSPVF